MGFRLFTRKGSASFWLCEGIHIDIYFIYNRDRSVHLMIWISFGFICLNFALKMAKSVDTK